MDWIIGNWIEILGYTGSGIVVLSLTMSNILKLRWINLLGASLFSIYGFLIGAIPVCIVNGIIVIIDIYYLVGMYRARECFSLMEVNKGNLLLEKFLLFFKTDIRRFFPTFNSDALDSVKYILVFRDVIPVGAFIYQKVGVDNARVFLDYISPNYRDYKNAEYLIHTRKEQFAKEGIKTLETSSQVKVHQKYLQKIGFTKQPDSPLLFKKIL